MKTAISHGFISLLFFAGAFFIASAVAAAPARFNRNNRSYLVAQNRAGSRGLSSLAGGSTGTVQVRGQSRNLSMMLVLKNGKDEINFIKPRTNYRAKVLSTQF